MKGRHSGSQYHCASLDSYVPPMVLSLASAVATIAMLTHVTVLWTISARPRWLHAQPCGEKPAPVHAA